MDCNYRSLRQALRIAETNDQSVRKAKGVPGKRTCCWVRLFRRFARPDEKSAKRLHCFWAERCHGRRRPPHESGRARPLFNGLPATNSTSFDHLIVVKAIPSAMFPAETGGDRGNQPLPRASRSASDCSTEISTSQTNLTSVGRTGAERRNEVHNLGRWDRSRVAIVTHDGSTLRSLRTPIRNELRVLG